MTETPIFDAVLREQGVDEMPLPPLKTHEEFMYEHGQDVWHERARMILAGEMDPSYYDEKTKARLARSGASDDSPIPIKKAVSKTAANPRPPRKKP